MSNHSCSRFCCTPCFSREYEKYTCDPLSPSTSSELVPARIPVDELAYSAIKSYLLHLHAYARIQGCDFQPDVRDYDFDSLIATEVFKSMLDGFFFGLLADLEIEWDEFSKLDRMVDIDSYCKNFYDL